MNNNICLDFISVPSICYITLLWNLRL